MNNEDLLKFIQLYKQSFSVQLDEQEARVQAQKLLDLMKIILTCPVVQKIDPHGAGATITK